MRTILITALWVVTILLGNADWSTAATPAVPYSVGGFTLDRSIDDYPVERHENYLSEVIVTDLNGFRKAFITFGTCRNPGKILRIKLKYSDRSQDFFKELLKRYREKFGAKPKFSGDQFGNVKSWKWFFTDEQGRKVTLQLQHNLKDEEESIGNMVKLSMPDLMDDERRCFNERHDKDTDAGQKKSEENNWENLIPH